MKKFALIVAGGSGSRMNAKVPKQFVEIADKPILMHTFSVFQKYDAGINFILVLPKNQIQQWNLLCEKFDFKVKYQLAFGGKNRFQSVKNGLDLISEEGIVFIHDGVRPLVSVETIKNCFSGAVGKGNALPVVPATESIRFSDGTINHSVDRSKYFMVQTPQTFRATLIKKAYSQIQEETFTDDASVLEKTGEQINLVEGNRENIKITYPEDVFIARTFFEK